MTFLGTILVNGMGYAVYGPRGATMADVWERHVLVCGGESTDVFLADARVRLVSLGEDPPLNELPDDFSDSMREDEE